MIDDRSGIALSDPHSGCAQLAGRCFPGAMDPGGRHARELGNPAADVGSLGIKLQPLAHRIEDPKKRGRIRAASRRPLPPERVVGQIRVDQGVPEPARAFDPVDQQILDQKRRRDHPHPVVHPAGGPELTHAGIDERIAGATALPASQSLRVAPPGEVGECGTEGRTGGGRVVMEKMVGEFAPVDLAQEGLHALDRSGGPVGRRRALRRHDDLSRADLAEMEMG